MRTLLRGTALLLVGIVTLMACEIEDSGWPYKPVDPRCPYAVHTVLADDEDYRGGSWEPGPLLAEVSAAGVLCVTANAGMAQETLDLVSRWSSTMLQHRPDIVKFFRATGEFVVLKAPDELWCDDFDLDFFKTRWADWCDKVSFTGLAGFYSLFIACPEEYLFLCVHEIAHAVYDGSNPEGFFREGGGGTGHEARDRVIQRFAEPDVAVLWAGDYALENAKEFFAEMTAIYFCAGSEEPTTKPRRNHGINCADELQTYDPDSYDVIHAIYRGSADLR